MVRKSNAAFFGLVLGFAATSSSIHSTWAVEYVVDPGGNDMSAGTAAAPWKTLQHAANSVGAGDHVTVHAGTYTGFNLTHSGNELQGPIEFQAQPGVMINVRNSATPDGINLEGASYVVIDGFTVNNMPRTGIRTVGAPDDFADHVTLRNNTAAGNQLWGILTGWVDHLLIESNTMSGSKEQHGIYVSNSGDWPIVRNNVVFDNMDSGIQINADGTLPGDGIITGAVVSGNRIFNNGVGGGSALNFDGVQESTIENNLLYGNHSSGISLYHIDGTEGSKNNVVVNNTIVQASDGRWALNIQSESTGNTVRNNVLLQPAKGAIDISPDSRSGFTSDYNVVTNNFTTNGGGGISLATWRMQTGQDMNSIVSPAATALFVNPATGDYHNFDFHLLSTAAAINIGTLANAPDFDLEGKHRPIGAGIDVGAYEFGVAATSGDYNHDNIVNAADYNVWRDTFGSTTNLAADGNGNHGIDNGDFTIWKNNFAAGSGGGGATLSSVPEPAAAVLAVLVIACFAAARSVTAARRPC